MGKYSSLIIDIKQSRTYNRTDRTDIQKFIKQCILSLNSIFAASLQMDMRFSGGDEMQGLFRSADAAYLYHRLFNMLIAPVEVRAGIGVGDWNVRMDSGDSTEQDGPVYHNAKYAIKHAGDRQDYNLLLYSKHRHDAYINSHINMLTLLINAQSELQNELLLLTELMYPIVSEATLDVFKLAQLTQLLAAKNALSFYSRWKQSKSVRQELNFARHIELIQPIDINDIDQDDNTFYVTAGKTRGIATKLSHVLGTTRQNIDKSIKAGNIFAIRNASIVVAKLLRECGIGV